MTTDILAWISKYTQVNNVGCDYSCMPKLNSGPFFNITSIFPKYGDSLVKDQMVARPSYLKHGDPYTGKMISLYWNAAQKYMG